MRELSCEGWASLLPARTGTPTVAPLAGVSAAGTIGHYRLLERLGEGGRGEVWLAEQARPVHRQVALKVKVLVMQEASVSAISRLPEDHPLVLIIDGSIATMIAALGRDAEAEPLFQRTLATRIKAQGEDHPDVATSRLMYGRFLLERRRYAEAEPLLVQAFEVRREKRGPTHPDTARAAQDLAALYRATGREDQAAATERAVK